MAAQDGSNRRLAMRAEQYEHELYRASDTKSDTSMNRLVATPPPNNRKTEQA